MRHQRAEPRDSLQRAVYYSHAYLRISGLSMKTAARPINSEESNTRFHQSRRNPPLVVVTLAAFILAYAVFFGWESLMRYWTYQMHALDMGNMGQAAWNTLHGHPFYFTNMRLAYALEAWRTTTRLSFHVEAIFPLLSLVYIIYSHPESLLVLQTVALSLGAIPVYLLARNVLRSTILSLLFPLVYLLVPTLEGMNLYEFHPVSLATPLLLGAFLFAWQRKYVPFILCSVLAIGTKEEIGLVVAMFGLYVALINRDRVIGIFTAVGGVGWSLFAALVIEHHFRQPGSITYFHSRYGYLGHGIHGALQTVLHDPDVFVRTLFTWPKLGYVNRLLLPTGYLALLNPATLLLGLPTFALNLLSTDIHMYSGLGDNSAELVSVSVIAAILGTRSLLGLLSRLLTPRWAVGILAGYIGLLAVWDQHINGFTPIGSMFQMPAITAHDRLADRFVSLIPPSVPVSTQDTLDPHLSSRRYLYLLEDTGRIPPVLPAANYILLDVSAPTYPLPSWQLYDRAQTWIHHPGWGIKAAEDGLILIERGARRSNPPASFYTYAYPQKNADHPLRGDTSGLRLVGFDVARTDLPNHYVPNLAYSFYLRARHRLHKDIQPVVYEVINGTMIGCAHEPLGLSWLPTSHWSPQRTYLVRMEPLQTDWQTPGIAHLYLGFAPQERVTPPTCSSLWQRHAQLWPIGSLNVSFG